MVRDLIERHTLNDRPIFSNNKMSRYLIAVGLPPIDDTFRGRIALRIVQNDVLLKLRTLRPMRQVGVVPFLNAWLKFRAPIDGRRARFVLLYNP